MSNIDGLQILNFIESWGWEAWNTDPIGQKRTGFIDDFQVTVTLVEKIDGSYGGGDQHYNYYEAPQGWEGISSLIFKVETSDRDDRFFKKEATVSSYGDVSWDKPFKEVFPTTKTVTVYDFK